MKRKICVFSGKRGGFGAYVSLMQLIENDSDLELQILLGDMHASVEFGKTFDEVRRFFPSATIEIIEMGTGRGDTPLIRAENLGQAMIKSAQVLEKLKPNIVLVHADRGEHLMVAFAALNLGLVVAHTQGGEISGNIDDIQRHAITKLAHIHFPETQKAATRILFLGEESWRIYIVGSLYIDRIYKKMYPPIFETQKKYGLLPKESYFMILFHPDTFETKGANYRTMSSILESVEPIGIRSFVVYPCSDPGYEGVVAAIEKKRGNENFMIYKNIDNLDFLSLMSEAKLMIGNSSGALNEAPYFRLPAINIGNRQHGRDREENVIDSEPNTKSISKAIKFALKNGGFKSQLSSCGHRLGDGEAGEKILQVLKFIKIDEHLIKKQLRG